MRSREVNSYAFEAIVVKVSHELYEGNIIVHPNAASLRLSVASSRGPGARRSHSGRRMAAACWHAHRDVLRELFSQYPHATVRTALATYRGREGFEDWFEMTGATNVGSIAEPQRMDEACDCKLRELAMA
jgi:hypothetical protein